MYDLNASDIKRRGPVVYRDDAGRNLSVQLSAAR